ncbi:leucyl/phenylalanyl-tRNA--protein transferase [Rheinheimera sp.]|uniref:leucyl/phenylalanyl-tRNA--protein transferase n=1 Tax=Rheinheimera sp. TaxID=1869214 RepID=UPI002FDCC733
MPIYLPELREDPHWFPPLSESLSYPDGLLAMGGDLSPQRLLAAYQSAIFPWFGEDEPILWWSPATRAVFAPHQLQLNRSLKKYLKKQQYHFSCNMAFTDVVRLCAAPRANQQGTWIVPQMQKAYLALHLAGVAQSIEVWRGSELVGGLYGLTIGGLFCGESMFNLEANTAKLALVMLQKQLQRYSAGWIDCQMPNPFLLQLGVQPLPRADYLLLLNQLKYQQVPTEFWLAQALEFEL